MKYALWRLRHFHAQFIIVRRGKVAYCSKSSCGASFNLK